MKLTFGRYIDTNSWIHRLNPVVKIFALLSLIVSIFLVPAKSDMIYILVLLSFYLLTTVLITSAKVSMLSAIKSLKPVLILLVVTFIMQIAFEKKGRVLVNNVNFNISILTIFLMIFIFLGYLLTKKFIKFKIIYFVLAICLIFLVQHYINVKTFKRYTLKLTDKAFYKSIFLAIRVINVILITSLLTYTTNIIGLNYGVSGFLFPLKLIKIPVDAISMMISLTFRFIPTLYDETIKISKAQMSRGVDFKESNFFKRIKQVVSFLIPLFILSFKKAEDLANAMEIRNYEVGMKRTSLHTYKVKIVDIFVILFSIIFLAGFITFNVLVRKGVILK